MYSSVDFFFFNIKKLYCQFKMFFVAFWGGGGGKGKLPCQREGFVGARGPVAGSSGPFAGLSGLAAGPGPAAAGTRGGSSPGPSPRPLNGGQ